MRPTILFPALLLVASLAIGGCEETVDITDATYVERLVVYSVLEAGRPVTATFTRTLPINQPYSESAAALSDVDARVEVTRADGSSGGVLTLTHAGGGRYTASDTAEAGASYRLVATWRGRSLGATTRVPLPAVVDSVGLIDPGWQWEDRPDESYHVRALIDPHAREVYLLTSGYPDPRTGETRVFTTYGAPLSRERDTNDHGRLDLVDRWSSHPASGALDAVIVGYDEPYYEFQRTYYRGDDQGPFGTGSDNVKWTVEGDGIGLFIGRTTTIVRVR